MDSIRGIKYIVPLILVLCLWPLSEMSHKNAVALSQPGIGNADGSVVVGGRLGKILQALFLDAARAWSQGSLMPAVSSTERAGIEAMKAVRRITPAGSKILPQCWIWKSDISALRPIAYAYKDGGIFADTNLGALAEWDRVAGRNGGL